MTRIPTISPTSQADLSAMLAWWRQAKRVGLTGMIPSPDGTGERHVRWVQTATTDECSQYPASGNVLPIRFGDYEYDNSQCGTDTAEFKEYTPQDERIAFFPRGWVPQGTVTRATLHHGRWYAEPFKGLVHLKTPAAGIPARSGTVLGSALCDLWEVVEDPSTVYTLTAILDGSSAIEVRCLNKSVTAVAGDSHIMAEHDDNGHLIAIWEDCAA